MKKIARFIALALCAIVAFLSTSCYTYYSVNAKVNSDGSLTKTVYGKADSSCLAGNYSHHPFLFDAGNGWEMGIEPTHDVNFLGDAFSYNFYAQKTFVSGADAGFVPKDDKDAALPYLNGREEWKVERGFFADRYYYSCKFPEIGDIYPLPLDDYMDEEEKRMFFSESRYQNFKGLTGSELFYYFLGDIHSSFVDWQAACIVEYLYELIVTDTGTPLSKEQKDELLSQVYKDMGNKTGDIHADIFNDADVRLMAYTMSEVSGNHVYIDSYQKKGKDWENRFAEDYENIYTYPFTYIYRYTVEMPGKLTASNAHLFEDGSPVWKVDGFRLLGGDVILTAESREVNIWSFALLGLILICGIAALLILRRKSK